jgi:hypothetical protein
MSDTTENPNPMEFFKSLWGNIGIPLPGMVTPTIDTDELGRRITDLKAVEGWLKGNLSMLQMTIQGLEMQRATLMAFQSLSQQSAEGQRSEANPFANPAMWSWGFPPPTPTENDAVPEPPAAEASTSEAPEPSAPKRKPKR